MSQLKLESPITFTPIFQERIWGGRKLADLFGKNLPAEKRIGESWEVVDRPEVQSVVTNGRLKGKTLHELWSQHRQDVFGEVPSAPRFPLLIKLLDAREKLSLQVHPPETIAAKLGGEPKTECWYVAATEPNAELFAGFKRSTSREEFENALRAGSAADQIHSLRVKAGDAMFLPAGRLHAIGGGNLLVEIQQNSDTTYRVFDWNRIEDSTGKPRQLHVDQALESIEFADVAPKLVEPKGEVLVRHELFEIRKWNLDSAREISARGRFAIVCCLSGSLQCADVVLRAGEFFLVPASLQDRQLQPQANATTLLRVTIPPATP